MGRLANHQHCAGEGPNNFNYSIHHADRYVTLTYYFGARLMRVTHFGRAALQRAGPGMRPHQSLRVGWKTYILSDAPTRNLFPG